MGTGKHLYYYSLMVGRISNSSLRHLPPTEVGTDRTAVEPISITSSSKHPPGTPKLHACIQAVRIWDSSPPAKGPTRSLTPLHTVVLSEFPARNGRDPEDPDVELRRARCTLAPFTCTLASLSAARALPISTAGREQPTPLLFRRLPLYRTASTACCPGASLGLDCSEAAPTGRRQRRNA